MSLLLSDLRLAIRLLVRHSGFAAIAAGTLALGIGANTAVFSLLNAVLLRPLPYAAPERLVVVWEQNFARSGKTNVVGPANFLRWRERTSSFSSMAAIADGRANVTGSGEPVELQGQAVNAALFPLLGATAALGRTFRPDEDQPGHDSVVLLSDRAWKQLFGGDPGIIGRRMTMDNQAMTVVGVMPPGFAVLSTTCDYWTPMAFDAGARAPRGRYLRVVARLRDGVSLERAQAEMDVTAAGLRKEFPAFDTGWGVRLVSLSEQVVGEVRPILLVLFGAVGVVLLLACVNVANLVLNRGLAREREFALRAALGAGRGRLVRQVLTEGALLALVGGALGVGLAAWALAWLVPAAGRVLDIPRIESVNVDITVLLFALLVSMATVTVFALVPAMSLSRLHLDESLRQGARSGGTDPRRRRLRQALAVVQLSLAFVLLIGAGLMLRSVGHLLAVDPGFQPDHVLTMRLLVPSAKYAKPDDRVAFFDRAMGEIRRVPGVAEVGATSGLPFNGLPIGTSFSIEGRPFPGEPNLPVADIRIVQGEYFRAMRIRLLAGRLFEPRDGEPGRRAAIINETLARQLFGGENPMGQRVQVRLGTKETDEIVGVVADVKHDALDTPVRPMIYWPNRQMGFSWMSIVIRTAVTPGALANAAIERIHRIDPEQPVSQVATMAEVVGDSIARRRFTLTLLGVFGGLALLLAGLGVYGVLSTSVAQRIPELGIRLALGARPASIVLSVLGDSAALTGVGILIGVVGAALASRALATLLYGVSATDATTFVAVAVLLAAAATLAAYLPARRAARIDPLHALRME